MFEFKINQAKNAVLCILEGKFDADEARGYNEKFCAAIDQLEPGLTIITDLTHYIPAGDEVRSVLAEGTRYARGKGVAENVRIVSDDVGSQVGNIQLNKTARDLGYEVKVVHSLKEARQALGWE